MENTTVQTTNVAALTRTLPWSASVACWPAVPRAAVLGIGTSARIGATIRPMSGVDYVVSAPATTTGQTVQVVRDHDADHKFSPRLGPTARPPV